MEIDQLQRKWCSSLFSSSTVSLFVFHFPCHLFAISNLYLLFFFALCMYVASNNIHFSLVLFARWCISGCFSAFRITVQKLIRHSLHISPVWMCVWCPTSWFSMGFLYAIELPHFAAVKAHSAERFMNFDCYIKRPNPVSIYISTLCLSHTHTPFLHSIMYWSKVPSRSIWRLNIH